MIPWRLHPILHRTRDTSGFTLLEVLVSSAILIVLVTLLLGMVDGASRVWRDGERRREASREARAGLRMIADDLHSAVLTGDRSTLDIKEQHDETGRGQSLFFLVSHPGEQKQHGIKGDLCASGYFVAEAPDRDGVRNLYRFHASGNDVTDAYRNNTLPSLYAEASPGNANTELIARHITSLKIRAISRSELDSTPDALQITLSAINGDTARMISSKPEAADRNANLLRHHGMRFTTVIRLPPRREPPADP